MDTKKLIEEKIKEIDDKFSELISNDCLDINSIELLGLNGIEECKKIITNHIEELIMERINEKELITKKNKNGKLEDLS